MGDSSVTGLVEPVPSGPIISGTHARGAATNRGQFDWLRSRPARLLALVLVYAVVVFAFPRPATVSPEGWRITALFLATIAGLMIQPLPGAALVIIGLTLFVLVGGLPATRALGGFASPSVWLVLAAMLMSRALRETGLSRRIALVFVGLFGRTSLGVSYSLVLSDVTLAAGIPSITARGRRHRVAGGAQHRRTVRVAPGADRGALGTFLMAALYQGSAIACAMFMTGQASNVLAAGLAAKLTGVDRYLVELVRRRSGSRSGLLRRRSLSWSTGCCRLRCGRHPAAATFARDRARRRWGR